MRYFVDGGGIERVWAKDARDAGLLYLASGHAQAAGPLDVYSDTQEPVLRLLLDRAEEAA